MDLDEEKTEKYIKIKNKLNQEKIKLWLPPYLKKNGKKNSSELQKLADSCCEQLSLPVDQCLQLLENMQIKALKNFKDYNRYLSTGEAALRVKLFSEVGEAIFTVHIDLERQGYDLKLRICRQASIMPYRVRMIFRGKLVNEELPLSEQNIKHGLHIIAIVLKPNCPVLELDYDSDTGKIKAAVDVVILFHKGYFQCAEHMKRLSDMPRDQRKFLIGGMKLHQVGRFYIKKGDFASALAILLAAEENFSHFDPSYLENFSNCIVLNLDIMWCYLNLHCLVLFPGAEEKLRQFEEKFKKIYGEKLENIPLETDFRWTALILMMRLHLLQATVLYHQNKIFKSGILIKKMEQELRGLKVNKRHLTHLMELGYRKTETLFALREADGDMSKAQCKMEKNREEKTEKLFEQVKKGHYSLKSEARGSNSQRDRRNKELYNGLISMGFSEEVCEMAMERKRYTAAEDDDGMDEAELEENGGIFMRTIITIGFHPKKARAALQKHGGDFDAAVQELFKKEFLLGYESYIEFDVDAISGDDDLDTEVYVSSNTSDPTRAFYFEFREPVSCSRMYPQRFDNIQYDYIDIYLSLETIHYQKYKALVRKLKQYQNTN